MANGAEGSELRAAAAEEAGFPWVAAGMMSVLGLGLWWLLAGDEGDDANAPANRCMLARGDPQVYHHIDQITRPQ